MAKFLTLVIDSFGVGAMPDVPQVRPQDAGANTCAHILRAVPALRLPALQRLGLINALGFAVNAMQSEPRACYGTALLRHQGGDTFMGHQEIMGTLPLPPLEQPFSEVIDSVETALIHAGYHVERISLDGLSYLWVNSAAAIGDNLEADPGQVYNISANLSELSFEQTLAIGQCVRNCVQVGRVITFGGELENSQQLQAAAETLQGRFIGINAPKSGAYQHHFQVAHLGYGVNEQVQVPAQLHQQGIETVLIGKVADIVTNPHGRNYTRLVDSQTILDITYQEMQHPGDAFICTNIQETDLAGHAQDVTRYAERLQVVDHALERIMSTMQPDDLLVVMADHGNDPTIGHSKHTREQVPLLVYSPHLAAGYLGVRESLADVGATVCQFFNAAAPQSGVSFLPLLSRSEPTL